MNYKDLVQFHPIESVIQLRDADQSAAAKTLVSTYVISDPMAQRLNDLIFPQLQYDQHNDNRGLLIVGNYGTGKSHLMSVVSAVAEDASLADLFANPAVRKGAVAIAGRFKVKRIEIGAVTMGLRDILCGHLQEAMEEWGCPFIFPAADKVRENKSAIEDMMAVFNKKYSDHGLLLVVDELLDYLRSRKDQELILDLGFLRELGEVCKDLRFRIMAGVQEAIFDSQRFAHVADTLGRVKDRFQQVKIVTTDVKFVVSQRLLQKTPAQLEQVRAYLAPYAKFYGGMNERMDEFCALFPIHPDYVETFQRIPIVEKRGVLQIISQAIKSLVGKPVPTDRPGILAYDSYWEAIIDNAAHRANPDVKVIMECSGTLEAKVQSALPKKTYRPMAVRIIRGISVHRLTTGDIHAPIGLTPEELRDHLCLYHPGAAELGGDPADDLLTVVENVLREIHKTVSGQFLTHQPDNRQWFLDLRKTDDYDALIEKRSESLSDGTLDRFYYDALRQVMECTDVPTHVTGYQIWQHELEWREHKAGRLGYLFFGAPNERSTAVPAREFYLYFIQPFDPPKFSDEKRGDEVFFRLEDKQPEFIQALKLYAGALELASTSSGVKKQIYEKKAGDHLLRLTKWLREHLLSAVAVTYQGSKKTLLNWLKGAGGNGSLTIRDSVNLVGSTCLAGQFHNVAPQYPVFSTLITYGRDGNATQAAQEALRGLSQSPRSKQANAVLDALGLLDGDRITSTGSPAARFLLEKLEAKGQGQVLNRSEIITTVEHSVDYMAPDTFRLEPCWVAVLAAALVYEGQAVLSLPGVKFDATNLTGLATTPVADLAFFKHLEKPKDWNVAGLRALFELLGLAPGLAVQVTQGDPVPVVQLQKTISERVEKFVLARQQLLGGLPFWGVTLYSDLEIQQLGDTMQRCKEFLEGLQAYNTPGKLKNFHAPAKDIEAHKPAFTRLAEVESLERFIREVSQLTNYLGQASAVLPDEHPWCATAKQVSTKLLGEVREPANRESAAFKAQLEKDLKKLKADYIRAYLELYRRARLNLTQDKAKEELLKDERFVALRRLAVVEVLNRAQLDDFERQLAELKTGRPLTEKDLDAEPQADFWPRMEPSSTVSAEARLQYLSTELVRIHEAWTKALLSDLKDPVTQANLELLKPAQKKLLSAFITAGQIPDEVSREFIDALQQALSSLTKLTLDLTALKAALFPDGSPASPEEFRARLDSYLATLFKGRDEKKVRIVLA
jgi:hypothetical protein